MPTATGISLSVVSQGEGRCQWERLEVASGQSQVVATFPGECSSSVEPPMAWSAEGKAALWDDGEGLWRVELNSGKKTKLPSVPAKAGSVGAFGFGPVGLPMILTVFTPEEGEKLEWEGKAYTPEDGPEGEPSLAHAFNLGKDNQWHHLEVKVSAEGADYSPGVIALAASKSLVTGTRRDWWAPIGEPVRDTRLITRLNTLFGVTEGDLDPNDSWVMVAEGVYDWEELREGRHVGTPMLAFESGGELIKAPQLPEADDSASVAAKGDYVLLFTPRHARLYLSKQARLVQSFDGVRDIRFWP